MSQLTDKAALPVLHHFIDGRPMAGRSDRYADLHNPATGEPSGRVPLATADEVREAVLAARRAFPAWSATPPAQRAQVLHQYRALILQHMDELAAMLSAEHGKVLADARGSLMRGLEVVEFACGIPQMLKGEYSEGVARGIDSHSLRQPVGVCVGITPFNFPAMVPMWMFPVALACGNCFVLKPSEKDPSVTLRLVELAHEAGVPEGVLNLVLGDKQAVDALITDPDVDAVSFVGSTAVGRHIYETAAAHGKRVQALGGAKNHLVVMPDADMDQVVGGLMGAAYGSAGERCMAVSVAVPVGQGTADELVRRLVPRVEALRVGPYTDPDAEMGPLISDAHRARVMEYVESGVRDGARLLVDGRGLKLQGYEQGYFMGGCLFDEVQPEMRIYLEEIFGPVLSIVRAPDFDAALGLVNDHQYGNGASIFTSDGDTARRFTSQARIGMVGVNVPIPVPVAYHSFGGWKDSLFGDLHIHGPDGVRFYTRLKTMTTRWPSGIGGGAAFHFRRGSDS